MPRRRVPQRVTGRGTQEGVSRVSHGGCGAAGVRPAQRHGGAERPAVVRSQQAACSWRFAGLGRAPGTRRAWPPVSGSLCGSVRAPGPRPLWTEARGVRAGLSQAGQGGWAWAPLGTLRHRPAQPQGTRASSFAPSTKEPSGVGRETEAPFVGSGSRWELRPRPGLIPTQVRVSLDQGSPGGSQWSLRMGRYSHLQVRVNEKTALGAPKGKGVERRLMITYVNIHVMYEYS